VDIMECLEMDVFLGKIRFDSYNQNQKS